MSEYNRVVIPIGPQHPSLKEPACFTVTLEGEKIVDAVVGIGYNHRGMEKACESRNYIKSSISWSGSAVSVRTRILLPSARG